MSYGHDQEIDIYGDDNEVAPTIVPARLTLRGHCKCDCGWSDCKDYESGNDWDKRIAHSTLVARHGKHLTKAENGPCFCTPIIEENFL